MGALDKINLLEEDLFPNKLSK